MVGAAALGESGQAEAAVVVTGRFADEHCVGAEALAAQAHKSDRKTASRFICDGFGSRRAAMPWRMSLCSPVYAHVDVVRMSHLA